MSRPTPYHGGDVVPHLEHIGRQIARRSARRLIEEHVGQSGHGPLDARRQDRLTPHILRNQEMRVRQATAQLGKRGERDVRSGEGEDQVVRECKLGGWRSRDEGGVPLEGLDHPAGLWSLKVLGIQMLPVRGVDANKPTSLCKNIELLFQRLVADTRILSKLPAECPSQQRGRQRFCLAQFLGDGSLKPCDPCEFFSQLRRQGGLSRD